MAAQNNWRAHRNTRAFIDCFNPLVLPGEINCGFMPSKIIAQLPPTQGIAPEYGLIERTNSPKRFDIPLDFRKYASGH
jgi:hypothetical protein